MTEMVLKPCPFCGSRGALWTNIDNTQCRIECIAAANWTRTTPTCSGASLTFPSASEAITAWNTRASPSAPVGEGWQPIETAPKDGTLVLAWCVHPFRRYGGEGYEGPVIAHWTNHNDGGWTWYGLTGQFTHWMPLPQPPALLSPGEAK